MRTTSVGRELPVALLALAVAIVLVGGLVLLVGVVTSLWVLITEAWVATMVVIPPLAITVGAVAVPLLSIDVYAIRHVRRTGGLPAAAVRISPTEAPRLRTLVTELAEDMNTSAPTHLWLTPHANASVHETYRFMRRPRRTRHLCIGVPLLIGLTTEQLRAVLCHELAHYARRHAAFSTTVHRGSAVLNYILAELDRTALPTSDVATIDKILRVAARLQCRIFSAYARLYDVVTIIVRRRHEYAADRIAANTVGAGAVAEALQASYAVGAAWEHFCATAPFTRGPSQTSDGPFRAFAAMTCGYQPVSYSENLMRPQRESFWDSHPSLEKRLRALRQRPATTGTARTAPSACELLLGDEPALLARAEQVGFPGILRNQDERFVLYKRSIPEKGGHGESMPTQFYRRLLRNPAAVLFTLWFLIVTLERVLLLLGVYSATVSVIFSATFLTIMITILGVTFLPLDRYRYDPQIPRRLRRWLNPATAIVITYIAVAILATYIFGDPQLLFYHPAGLLISVAILLVGAPLYNPRAKVSGKRAIGILFLMAMANSWITLSSPDPSVPWP